MTNAEVRFMECVPSALKKISDKLDAVGTKFVRINKHNFVNPAGVTYMRADRQNCYGGIVTMFMSNGAELATEFTTLEDAAAALAG